MIDSLLRAAAALSLLLTAVPAAARSDRPDRAARQINRKDAPPPRRMPVPVVQDYVPRPAVWLLSDEDTRIYLFGTIHMLPPQFRWRSPALDRIVAEADTLAVETYIEPGAAEAEELPDALLLAEPRPILERVPAEHRATLAAAIARTPVPIAALDRMPTWLAAIAIGIAGLLDEYGVDDPDEAPGVEDVLEREFRDAGKPIVSVEDGDAVMAAMNALPEDAQVELLIADLVAEGAIAEEVAGAEPAEPAEPDDHAWARGAPEGLADDMLTAMPPVIYDVLLRRRNAAWTDWLIDRLERPGTMLFAVGAGHLAGPDSVQAMLAARGFEAKRID